MKPQPYTLGDLTAGEQIVRELHGLKGYDAWAERIAKAIAAERERCASVAECLNGWGAPRAPKLANHIASVIRRGD